jgi:RNA polymerase sigma-70 factor (ECF subfamily)
MSPARERALVERVPTDASAFAELYDFYLPRIYGYLMRRAGERVVAEDLTAATFTRAFEVLRAGTFRNESLGGWLYRVAGNALVDHVRRSRRYVPGWIRASDAAGGARGDDGSPGGELESAADDRAVEALTAAIERDALARAITRLPDAHRRVVVLRYLDGLEPGELAGALGCSRTTASVRLHRALRALRTILEQEAADVA